MFTEILYQMLVTKRRKKRPWIQRSLMTVTTGRRGDAAAAPHVAAAHGAVGYGRPAKTREINEAADGDGKTETSTILVSASFCSTDLINGFHFKGII